jgi:hypothetical protein
MNLLLLLFHNCSSYIFFQTFYSSLTLGQACLGHWYNFQRLSEFKLRVMKLEEPRFSDFIGNIPEYLECSDAMWMPLYDYLIGCLTAMWLYMLSFRLLSSLFTTMLHPSLSGIMSFVTLDFSWQVKSNLAAILAWISTSACT